MNILAICRNCSQEIAWPKPYRTGNKPINKDGTAHNCLEGGKDNDPTQQQFNPDQPQVAQTQQSTIHESNSKSMSKLDVKFEEIDKLDQMLFDVSINRLEAIKKQFGIDMVPINEALIFVESWSRTLAQTLK